MLQKEFTDLDLQRKAVEERFTDGAGTFTLMILAFYNFLIFFSEKLKKMYHTSRPGSSREVLQRVAFGARLLISSDSDALREFTGFFWPEDSTLAIYEFRGTGKPNSRVPPRVLPFVNRGVHKHAGGIK